MRATASGRRTGTAGQTGQSEGLSCWNKSFACFVSQYVSLVSKSFQIIMEILKKKGGGCICGLCDDGGSLLAGGSQKDKQKFSLQICRRNVPSSGEFYCARGTFPRAGARSHGAGAGDWGPGQRRPGQRSETQHSALTENRGDPGPGNGLDR